MLLRKVLLRNAMLLSELSHMFEGLGIEKSCPEGSSVTLQLSRRTEPPSAKMCAPPAILFA
jgi:hypothetical protein